MRSAIAGGGDADGSAANAMLGELIRIRTETVNPSNMAPDIVSFFEFEGIMACLSSVHSCSDPGPAARHCSRRHKNMPRANSNTEQLIVGISMTLRHVLLWRKKLIIDRFSMAKQSARDQIGSFGPGRVNTPRNKHRHFSLIFPVCFPKIRDKISFFEKRADTYPYSPQNIEQESVQG
jgi:hypothetical protein